MPEKDWQAEIAVQQERERKARAILGVSDTADAEEIRRAFRRLSLACHPDANPGDDEAAERFHLACCAQKFLVTGETCEALDNMEPPAAANTNGKYRMDNPWGYWCWWRENYFEQ